MRRGDGLTYIFDNVIEAILFVISNVKEDEDLVETFSKCKMVEINMTKNIFISTNMSNYIITNTESLKFDNTPVKKENDISDNVKAEIMADIGDLRLSNYLNPACKNNYHQQYKWISNLPTFFAGQLLHKSLFDKYPAPSLFWHRQAP